MTGLPLSESGNVTQRSDVFRGGYVKGYAAALADVEQVLSEVSRDYAGARVNAGAVVGSVRRMVREQLTEEGTDHA